MCTRLAPGTKGCLTSVTDTVVDLFDEMNARVARVDTHPITADGDTTRGGDACVLRRATRGQGWPRLERPGMARAGPTQHTRTSAATRSSIPPHPNFSTVLPVWNGPN